MGTLFIITRFYDCSYIVPVTAQTNCCTCSVFPQVLPKLALKFSTMPSPLTRRHHTGRRGAGSPRENPDDIRVSVFAAAIIKIMEKVCLQSQLGSHDPMSCKVYV